MPARKYAITHLYKDVDARLKLRSSGYDVDDEDQWGYAREMDQVAAAVHGFTIYDAAVPVRQMTAISNLASRDGDVRSCPTIRSSATTGRERMVSRRDDRRQLNQRILQRAPCTVGASSSATSPASASPRVQSAAAEEQESAVHHVVAVFLGGPAVAEAVAYATRLSAHPSVSMSVSRFRLAQPAASADEDVMQTEDLQEDEEFMAEVYAGFVAPGRVSYTETYVSNGVETLHTLSAMTGMCSLFVVGRGGGGGAA